MRRPSGDCSLAGWELMLGSIAAFYAIIVPYTKVEESFNVQVIIDFFWLTWKEEIYLIKPFQCQIGDLLDQRIVSYILPIFSLVVLYSKLLHKELRFVIGLITMLNVSAALAASRVYNNRRKAGWKLLYVLMINAFFASLGYTAVPFMASSNNYPGGYALKALHEALSTSAGLAWTEIGFPGAKVQPRIPQLYPEKEPKVFARGNMRDPGILLFIELARLLLW
ncbi:hypothetical protein GUJ93_ZPchr0014g46640 [Zizania palustris]|nr:hypothetical protein GUJ93_ZPchr0014g46640 [Zizania palustris]